jgi:NADH:ubiquinone oxidoreductase subunit 6 (subunit J)
MNATLVRAGAVAAMALMFIGAVMMVDWPDGGTDDLSTKDVAWTLFGTSSGSGYALIVFLIGLLLLVALLGGVFLAKEERE